MNSGTVKCLFIGDYNSGKTTLLHRMEHDEFITASPTVGVEFHVLAMPNMDDRVTVWNLAGSDRFQEILKLYYNGSDIIFVTIDASIKGNNVGKWILLAKDRAPQARLVLLFTKVDLPMAITNFEMDTMLAHYGAYASVAVSAKSMDRETIVKILAPTFRGITAKKRRDSVDLLGSQRQTEGLLCCEIQ